MTIIAVGKDILAFCTKCNLTLSHIIVAMKNDKYPAKVKCNTCQATHAFRDSKPKAKANRKAKTPDIPINELWAKALKSVKVQARPYSIKTKFSIGDLINHTVFGQGIVQHIVDTNKIEVLFENAMKQLVHDRR